MKVLSFKDFGKETANVQLDESVIDTLGDEFINEGIDDLLSILGESVDGVIMTENSNVFNHIFEQHRLLHEAKYVQPWAKDLVGKSPSEQYYIVREYADVALKEYNRMAKNVASKYGKSTKILLDTKSHDSWIDKTVIRKKSPKTIDDVIRGAILARTSEDVDNIITFINKKYKVVDHDYKKEGGDTEYGYFGSHHMSVVMGNGVAVELQVMTKRLWTAKTPAHDIYNDYRSLEKVDPKQKERDLEYSRNIFRWGNGKRNKV